MAPAAERSVRRHRARAEHARTRRAIAVGRPADVRDRPCCIQGPQPTSPTTSPTRPTRPTRLVTTDGEFHTIRRQLDRLAEEGVPVIKVAAHPAETLAERLAATVDASTACVLVSSVLFETAEIVPDLKLVAAACARHGAALLVDAYHHLNVVPFDIDAMGLAEAFVVGGGYKYCQLGEGNCFLRVPPGLRAAAGPDRLVQRVRRTGRCRTRGGGALRQGRGALCRSDLRSDVALSRGGRLRVSSAHGDDARAAPRDQPASGRDAHRSASKRSTSIPRSLRSFRCQSDRRAGFLAIRAPQAAALVLRLRARGLLPTRGATSCASVPRPTFPISNCSRAAASSRLCFASSLDLLPVPVCPLP